MQVQPTPQQLGFIIGRTIEHLPVRTLLATHGPGVYEEAGVDPERVHAEYLLLLTSAAMHAVESAGLHVDAEQAVAQGLYDWMRQLPGGAGAALVCDIESATDAYAKAAEDDLHMERAPGELSQLELEFFDHLMALGPDAETRAKACMRIAAVLPRELWDVQVAGTRENLRLGGLTSNAGRGPRDQR